MIETSTEEAICVTPDHKRISPQEPTNYDNITCVAPEGTVVIFIRDPQ